MVKRNQFEVGQIQFKIFYFIACTIYKANFCRPSPPIEIYDQLKGCKTIRNREHGYHFLFFSMYVKTNISDFRLIWLDHITRMVNGLGYR